MPRYGKGPNPRHLWKTYGLTLEQFWTMVDSRNGECDICHTVKGNQLRVDHCHITGKIRGLLCSSCNTGIGQFGDDPKTLFLAWNYVRKFEKAYMAA